MNRSELEGLIAQTMQEPYGVPLSPKQQFQSQVRGLSSRPVLAQAQCEPATASVSGRHELHHVASLRVQHKQTSSAVPSTRRAALSETSHNLHRSKTAAFTDHVVPDFSAAEREAWSKKSPRSTSTPTRSRHAHLASSPSRQQAVKQRQLLLFPPPERLEPTPQTGKQAMQPSRRHFEPLQTETDPERPKTSRGLPSQSPERPKPRTNIKEQEGTTKKQIHRDVMSRTNHRSKFLEGSMNDRSVGVASSWYHDNTSGSEGFDDSAAVLANDSDTDSVATPQPSKPLPPTSAPLTTKKSIFKFGGVRTSEDSAHTIEEVPKNAKEHKGLRKSISIWNFQALGDKIFGGSTKDSASETSTDTITDKRGGEEKDKKTSAVADIDVLNERKRKAEEAYAQQFGLKKQKSNLGLSVASTPAAALTNKTTFDNKRPKTPTIFRRKHDQRTPGDQKRAAEIRDSHKRPSRKDLEKENQRLRSMLRESQSMTFLHSASTSSLNRQLKSQENLIRGPVVILSPGKKQGRRGEDIPPVPKLPDQEILAELQNRSGLLRPAMETEKENQASFETIEEGEEGVEMGKSERERSIPGQWEWPDDVF